MATEPVTIRTFRDHTLLAQVVEDCEVHRPAGQSAHVHRNGTLLLASDNPPVVDCHITTFAPTTGAKVLADLVAAADEAAAQGRPFRLHIAAGATTD